MSNIENKSSEIASRMRLARKDAGFSQSQLALMLGLHRPTISEMEAGRRKVSVEELYALAKIYNVRVAWLACKDDDPSRERTIIDGESLKSDERLVRIEVSESMYKAMCEMDALRGGNDVRKFATDMVLIGFLLAAEGSDDPEIKLFVESMKGKT